MFSKPKTRVNKYYISYEEAHNLLKEGDILLFRANGFVAKVISFITGSVYSHVGLASRHNGHWEIIEFHSSSGGDAKSLSRIVKNDSGYIDVYRCSPTHIRLIYNPETKEVTSKIHYFDGKKVTSTMRRLTGLPYGLKRIWWMLKRKLILWKILYGYEDLMNDEVGAVIYPVCSTAVSFSCSYNDWDLIRNRNDNWIEPGHIALSPICSELFTILWNTETDDRFLDNDN